MICCKYKSLYKDVDEHNDDDFQSPEAYPSGYSSSPQKRNEDGGYELVTP